MKAINIRTLKHQTRQVMERVAMGETMEILNHKKVVAVLQPPSVNSDIPVPEKFPDFAGRIKQVFGDKILKTDATSLLAEERDERSFIRFVCAQKS